jgi:AmiR/NasT family two-component response regulator
MDVGELHATTLRRAIESRDVIGQAKGILMTRQGVDADQAFALLRRTSQSLVNKSFRQAAGLAEIDGPARVRRVGRT